MVLADACREDKQQNAIKGRDTALKFHGHAMHTGDLLDYPVPNLGVLPEFMGRHPTALGTAAESGPFHPTGTETGACLRPKSRQKKLIRVKNVRRSLDKKSRDYPDADVCLKYRQEIS